MVEQKQAEETQVTEKPREMECKLQNMEEIHQETQCKLLNMEKKNKGLQVMFNEALPRNTQLQKEKEQQETTNAEL